MRTTDKYPLSFKTQRVSRHHSKDKVYLWKILLQKTIQSWNLTCLLSEADFTEFPTSLTVQRDQPSLPFLPRQRKAYFAWRSSTLVLNMPNRFKTSTFHCCKPSIPGEDWPKGKWLHSSPFQRLYLQIQVLSRLGMMRPDWSGSIHPKFHSLIYSTCYMSLWTLKISH